MNLFPFARAEFQLSNTERNHPFHHFYFSSFGEYPETRVVVNRGISEDLEITFFTDSRTPKVQQIQKYSNVSALFYHQSKQFQVRVYGTASLITKDDPGYAPYHKQVISNADWTRDYSSIQIPGVPRKDEGTIIYGTTINLIVVKIMPVKLDIVLLGATQHHRSKCNLINGVWEETVVVP